MASTNNSNNTNNERTGYADGYTRALQESFVPQASTFLRSRKQSISIDWEMGADDGGTPARIKGTMTYTRKVFADLIRDVLPAVLEHGSMSGFKGTDPANIGIPALATIISTVNGRSKQGYTTFAAQVATLRRTAKNAAKSAKNAADLKTARKAGNVFTDNKGKEWTSRDKAVKATARNLFGNDWWKDNKAANLSKAEAATPGGDAPAPVAQQSSAKSSVSAQQAKNMAKAMGATGADIKTKKAAEAFLAARGISL